MAKEISIPTLIVNNFETKDVVAFLTTKFKQYNLRGGKELEDKELAIYISILEALNKKLGGASGSIVL